MKNRKNSILFKNGFTLIELMVVIAIIGILAGVVMVSSKSAIDKSKKSAALTTASSILPELVTCQDDQGFADSAAPAANDIICCSSLMAHCTGAANEEGGHTAQWPVLAASTGWDYSGTPLGNLSSGNYVYTLKLVTDSSQVITCNMATGGCS